VHIVVVDPSRTILRAVSQILESDSYVVTTFVEGSAALGFIKSNLDVNVLITSAELGAMSGLELCWEARLLSGYDRAIYIILMSSNSEQKQLASAVDSGADELIRKPLVADEVHARLRSADRMLRLQDQLIRLARTDPLTGVLNRRAFFDEGQRLCRRAIHAARPIAIMFDVDYFKRVNDQFGHDVGDQVLRCIGQELPSEGAIVGRLGGEEFAILITGSDLAGGADLAESLRRRLAALSFDTSRGTMSISCSFGVAEWQTGESVDQLLKRADNALYRAKNEGRNRVVATEAAASVGPALDDKWSGLVRSNERIEPALPDESAQSLSLVFGP
jgi:two-component system, cell cycle response regulator